MRERETRNDTADQIGHRGLIREQRMVGRLRVRQQCHLSWRSVRSEFCHFRWGALGPGWAEPGGRASARCSSSQHAQMPRRDGKDWRSTAAGGPDPQARWVRQVVGQQCHHGCYGCVGWLAWRLVGASTNAAELRGVELRVLGGRLRAGALWVEALLRLALRVRRL